MSSIRHAFRNPLFAEKIRAFPSIDAAVAFIDLKPRRSKEDDRFNIQQTQANEWVVCRVISGGVQ